MSEQIKDPYNVTDLVAPYNIECKIENLMLPSFDGVKLHTIVFYPLNLTSKTGVIFVRSPYSRTNYLELPNNLALKNNFVYIMQACRGTGWSEGVWDPSNSENEIKDTANLIDWLANKEWFNGKIVMFGGSYPGWTQWCTQMVNSPFLVGIAPRVAPIWSCTGATCLGGGVQLSFAENWMLTMHHRRKYGYAGVPDFNKLEITKKLPVIDADKHALYGQLAPFRNFLKKAIEPKKHLIIPEQEFSKFTAPAFIAGGWFDNFKHETILSFMLMQKCSATQESRNNSFLTIGPWGHGGLLNPDLFGKECDYTDLSIRQDTFLVNLLNNPKENPLPNDPKVTYYMLGENKWYTADTWPPENTTTQVAYLSSEKSANSSFGDGKITFEENPSSSSYSTYISNPNAPVLYNNGNHGGIGCYDRSSIQQREDVLVFTTEPFKEEFAIAGNVKLQFTATISTPDSDIFATLTLLQEDGKAYFLTQGMVRARFKDNLEEKLLEPNKEYTFEINLSHIAVKLMPKMALRLDICGQNFPAHDRNANTGLALLEDTQLVPSKHTIFHDKTRPAKLIIPVLS